MRPPNGPMTGAEAAAFFRRAKREDPEYRARMKAVDESVECRAQAKAAAERPVLADLRAAGVKVKTLYDELPPATLAKALPVLVEHLEHGGFPADADTFEILGSHLAVKPAVAYWDRLKRIYLEARSAPQEQAAAIAMAGCATKAHYDELVELVRQEDRGGSRILFLAPIRTFGRERGWEVVESFREHPLLGKEATAMLKRREVRARSARKGG